VRYAFALLLSLPIFTIAQELKGGKHLPPAPEVEARAKLDVKSVFGAEIAKAKTPTAKKAIAEKMFVVARDVKETPANRWVLFTQARELAAAAGEVGLAEKSIEEQIRVFVVSRHVLAAELAEKLAATVRTRAVLDFIYVAAESAIDAYDFTSALKLMNAGLMVARELKKEGGMEKRFEVRLRTVQELKKAIESAKGDDVETGKILCFSKGDWVKGLPLLAKTKDADLKAVVAKDRSGPMGADRADLGDAWYELAEKAKATEEKIGMLRRALWWHRLGYADIGGLKKAKLDLRMKDEMERVEAEDVKTGLFTVWAGKWSVRYDSGATHLYRIYADGRFVDYGREMNGATKDGEPRWFSVNRLTGRLGRKEDGKLIESFRFLSPVTIHGEWYHPSWNYEKPDHSGDAIWMP
jgi:hypothetical protein